MELALIQDYVTSLFLHFVRVGAFVAVLPIFGRQRDSLILRLALSTALAAIFWWVGDQRIDTPTHLLELGVMGAREGVIGLALGFALATMTTMLVSAGEFLSHEMGFSLAAEDRQDRDERADPHEVQEERRHVVLSLIHI